MDGKKILLALCFLLCAQFGMAQYGTTYQKGLLDYRASMSTVNTWHALPTKTLIAQVEARSGEVYDLDTSGCVWLYDYNAMTYTQQTTWGCGWSEITTETISTYGLLVGLLKTDASCASGTKRFYWSYYGGAPGNTGACATHWYGGSDGSELQINRDGGHSQFDSIDIGTGWTSGYVASPTNACAIKNNQLYTVNANGTFVLYSPQPPAAPLNCLVGGAASGLSGTTLLMTWTETGAVYFYDAGWSTVSGMAANNLTGTGKATVLGLSSSGQPYHLNLVPGYTSGVTSGSYNHCPGLGNCPPGITHNGTLQIGNGSLGQQNVSPTTNINVPSFYYTTSCDLLFGNPKDPACNPNVTGAVICGATGATLATPGSASVICVEPSGFRTAWHRLSNVHVYFDSQYFTVSGSCVPPYTNACDVFLGMSSWSQQTINLTSYTFGGVVPMDGGCGVVGATMTDGTREVFAVPCTPVYPYIFVTKTPSDCCQGGLAAVSGSIAGLGGGQQYSFTTIPGNKISGGSAQSLLLYGAHEEGHRHGLGDCNPALNSGIDGCQNLDETQTVMWYKNVADGPTSPTACDIWWATTYEAVLP
jgi:hypothetical protein